MKGNLIMKTLWTVRLLCLSSIAALSWISAAPGRNAEARPDLAEYVYLHETRGVAARAQSSTSADTCRAATSTARPVRS